ncbi:hypothetical protein VPH35_052984 [Triticum aestivum]
MCRRAPPAAVPRLPATPRPPPPPPPPPPLPLESPHTSLRTPRLSPRCALRGDPHVPPRRAPQSLHLPARTQGGSPGRAPHLQLALPAPRCRLQARPRASSLHRERSHQLLRQGWRPGCRPQGVRRKSSPGTRFMERHHKRPQRPSREGIRENSSQGCVVVDNHNYRTCNMVRSSMH